MFIRSLRISRRFKRRLFRLSLIAAIIFAVIDTFSLIFSSPSPQRPSLATKAAHHERIFIASIHWNNEKILRPHWNKAVVDLVRYLGPQNVFVSVLESGSWDDSKGALRDLDNELEKLSIQRSIVLENVTHKYEVSRTPSHNETGWVRTPRGRKELRRIPYLATLRNRVMQEMTKEGETSGKRFDKVLWLNDVIFTTEDIITLLSTRSGDYAAAYSLDFSKPPLYYDTFNRSHRGNYRRVGRSKL